MALFKLQLQFNLLCNITDALCHLMKNKCGLPTGTMHPTYPTAFDTTGIYLYILYMWTVNSNGMLDCRRYDKSSLLACRPPWWPSADPVHHRLKTRFKVTRMWAELVFSVSFSFVQFVSINNQYTAYDCKVLTVYLGWCAADFAVEDRPSDWSAEFEWAVCSQCPTVDTTYHSGDFTVKWFWWNSDSRPCSHWCLHYHQGLLNTYHCLALFDLEVMIVMNVCWLVGSLPPPKEVMFLVQSVCLSVCWMKKLWTDFGEISWRGRAWPRDQWVQFWWQITIRIQESEVRNPDSLDYRITNRFWWNFTESWGVA